jgi:hypothetical protein
MPYERSCWWQRGIVKSKKVPEEEGLLEWAEAAFPLLSEFDKQVLVCTLLGCVIKRGLLKEVMG